MKWFFIVSFILFKLSIQVTTSSEALLAGKAPTFRLLVWAVDILGEPVSSVTYVVSENFVVRRCKQWGIIGQRGVQQRGM